MVSFWGSGNESFSFLVSDTWFYNAPSNISICHHLRFYTWIASGYHSGMRKNKLNCFTCFSQKTDFSSLVYFISRHLECDLTPLLLQLCLYQGSYNTFINTGFSLINQNCFPSMELPWCSLASLPCQDQICSAFLWCYLHQSNHFKHSTNQSSRGTVSQIQPTGHIHSMKPNHLAYSATSCSLTGHVCYMWHMGPVQGTQCT